MENERENTEVRSLCKRVWRVTYQRSNRKDRLLVTQSSSIHELFERRRVEEVRIRHNFGAAEHAVVNIAWNAAGIYSAIGKLGQSRWNNFSTTGRCITIVPLIKLSHILFELNIFSLRGKSVSPTIRRRWWKMYLYREITRSLYLGTGNETKDKDSKRNN